MTNPKGRFGIHGGQYMPETLMNAVIVHNATNRIRAASFINHWSDREEDHQWIKLQV